MRLVILLDTNVVSAIMAPTPARPVVDWLNRQQTAVLFVSAVTIAEIGYGLRILPGGRRRRSLEVVVGRSRASTRPCGW